MSDAPITRYADAQIGQLCDAHPSKREYTNYVADFSGGLAATRVEAFPAQARCHCQSGRLPGAWGLREGIFKAGWSA